MIGHFLPRFCLARSGVKERADIAGHEVGTLRAALVSARYVGNGHAVDHERVGALDRDVNRYAAACVQNAADTPSSGKRGLEWQRVYQVPLNVWRMSDALAPCSVLKSNVLFAV